MHCPDISFPFGIKDACIACVCEDQIFNTFNTVVNTLKANFRIADNSTDKGKSLYTINYLINVSRLKI